MPGSFTISETLMQTFRDTLEAVAELRCGGTEAALLHEGKAVSIRYVIEIVSIFEDRMPDDLYGRLCEVAEDGEDRGITHSRLARGASAGCIAISGQGAASKRAMPGHNTRTCSEAG